ncbi:hypothetical protein [Pseudomonas lactucae]
MRQRQRGVALLSVLLVMSLALLLTAGMLRSHHLMVQSSARQIHQLQLRQLALSAEAWAMVTLTAPHDDASSLIHHARHGQARPGPLMRTARASRLRSKTFLHA